MLLSASAASLYICTSTAQYLDLNSLLAFNPATPSDDLTLLSSNQAPLANTSRPGDADVSQNPSFSLRQPASSPPSSRSDINQDSPDTNHILDKRQSGCGSYNSCSNLGAPSLCCSPNQVCSADSLGRVGCCSVGAACTGQIPGAGGVVATATSGGYTVTTTAMPTTVNAMTTTAATTTVTGQGGFVLAGSETVAVLGSPNAAGAKDIVSSGLHTFHACIDV